MCVSVCVCVCVACVCVHAQQCSNISTVCVCVHVSTLDMYMMLCLCKSVAEDSLRQVQQLKVVEVSSIVIAKAEMNSVVVMES